MGGLATDRSGSSFEQRLDDEASTLAPAVLAGDLQGKLGQQVAARLVGLGDSRQIGRYRKGDGPHPRAVVELRMREAYKLVGMLAAAFSPEIAKSWLLGTNSRLGDRAPIDLIGVARTAEQFVPVRKAARQFVLSQSTVRDPLADIEAVRAARKRPMSERLEVALSWNLMASELRTGIAEREEKQNER